MPHRALFQSPPGVLLGVAGILLLGVLALAGVDAHAAARSGPRWRRVLAAAGLCLLASCGFGPAGREPASAAPAAAAGGAATDDLRQDARWKQLSSAWQEASEIASGKRGAYPFDQAGQKRVLASLAKAAANVDALRKAGLLSEPEAGLLKKELDVLVVGVQSKRPTEMKLATCYKPMMVQPARESLDRLAERLPVIEKLVESRTLHPAAVSRVLGAIEADLATLKDDQQVSRLTPDQQAKAEETRKTVAEQVAKLTERLKAGR